MADITYTEPMRGTGLAGRVRATLDSIGRAFIASQKAASRYDELLRLQSMTDAELAKMGLTRDRIAHHVYRDLFYI